jgi:SAM-dependent methyltransferase
MKNTAEAFIDARDDSLVDAQERNRRWWMTLPMTYQDWRDKDRAPAGDQIVATFLETNPFLAERHFALAGKDVLEIGCGAGGATSLFQRAGAHITAIDLTPTAVALTKAHCPDATVLEMDAERMSFPDASFDHVFSWGVIHHSARTENVLDQIARVLRPGGTGLIMVYNRNSLRYWLRGLEWQVARGKGLRGESIDVVQKYFTDGYYHRHFTPAEFRGAFESRGLKVTNTSISHMSKKMLPLIPVALDNYLKRRWGWLLTVEFVKS